MKLRLVLYTVIVLGLFACKTKIVYEDKFVPVLKASDIYNTDSVSVYVALHQAAHKEIAEGYLKQAEAFTATNPDKAIYAATRAVTLYPTKKNYLLLAEKLKLKNDAVELSRLYGFLCDEHLKVKGSEEPLFGAPDIDLKYEDFLYAILTEDYPHLSPNETDANKETIKKKLATESRLKLDRNSAEFQSVLVLLLGQDETKSYVHKPEVFAAFLRSIPDSTDHFSVSADNIYKFKYAKPDEAYDDEGYRPDAQHISYYYLFEQKGHEDGDYYYPGAVNFLKQYRLNENTHVVVYAIDSSAPACPVNMRHIYYRVVTYRKDASIIDSKVIASQAGEVFNTAEVDKNRITVTESRRNWEKPYRQNDFDNELQGTEKIRTVVYTISDEGKITESVGQP